MKKVTIIISEVDKSLHFEWLIILLKDKVYLSCILIGLPNTALESFLISNHIPVEVIPYQSKKNLFKAWARCFSIIKKQKPDIIHTHFWVATLLGISAGFFRGVAQRIYTRHHATFHHDYFRKGVYLDKLMSRMATSVVAPTKNVKAILTDMENVRPEKVIIINHGIDLNSFTLVNDEVVLKLREKYKITSQTQPVIGVISRYVELKGIHYIIPAFKKILMQYPNAKLILANAQGDFAETIQQQLSTLPPANFIEIRYESEVGALYKLFDIFIHVPVAQNSESFGLIYLEALALGVPSIVTLSGVANDIVKNRENALVVEYEDSEAVYKSILELLQDDRLRNSLKIKAPFSVSEFSMIKMSEKLVSLYNSEKSCVALQE